MEVILKTPEKYEKNILIMGVMHGDEPQGEVLIRRFLEEFDIKKTKNKIAFLPCINTFGRDNKIRTNKNGVDLNRNYPAKNWKLTEKNEYYGGNAPASEEETKFLINFIQEFKPDLILSFHAPFRIVNFDGDAACVAQKIAEITGYPVQQDIGYPTAGSFGTYFGIERNIPVITLELPENETNETLWQENKGVFEYLTQEF